MTATLTSPSTSPDTSRATSRRNRADRAFRAACAAICAGAVGVLALLFFHIARQGAGWVSVDFLLNYPSRFAERAGILSALVGSLWLMALTAALAIPLGVATAVYLEEYAAKNRATRFLELNIANLAGMPSIVYGLLGLAIFVRGLGMGSSLLAAALTLALVVLPVIVIASREAIRAVPDTLRQAGYALGAYRWQVVMGQVLPSALPGILTGVILAMSRAIGEAAPLIVVGAATYAAFLPAGPMDAFTALPIQIFSWASRPQEDFHALAAAAILVLLAALLSLNMVAVVLRQRGQRYRR